MVEKIITLENVSLIDFLGVENKNIKEVAHAFPKSKIVSRGNEIMIKGNAIEILKINDVLQALLEHYHRFGKITEDNVLGYLKQEEEEHSDQMVNDVLVFGTKGSMIKPKSPNQVKLVEASRNNDLVFAMGPAGTVKTYIAVALAVRALKNKEVRKIIITRPAVEAGENLGFLPGDLKEKIDPYLTPI